MLIGTIAGCQTTVPGEHYSVATMPETMIAMKRENARTVDLSKLASVAVNSELIDVKDVIDVTISTGLSEKESYTQPVRVRDDGVADIPVVGPVQVAGLELAEAEAAISAACIQRQLYRSPHVTVTMKHQRMNRVTVVGAVKEPGVHQIPRGQSDLLASLVAAGGLSDDAGTNVEIRNPMKSSPPPDPVASNLSDDVSAVGHTLPGLSTALGSTRNSIKVDLVAATKQGTGAFVVEDGAVVSVEKRDPEPVHVMGLVQKPNRYEFPIGEDLRVLDAIALAGWVTSPVANKVYIIRKKPESSKTAIIEVSIAQAKQTDESNLRLSPGDIVSVEQTPMTMFMSTVQKLSWGVGATLPLTTLF